MRLTVLEEAARAEEISEAEIDGEFAHDCCNSEINAATSSDSESLKI